MITLNHKFYPEVKNRISGFYQLGNNRTEKIKKLPQVYGRTQGILKFLFHFSPENDAILKQAYLRAALTEFTSIEEVLESDLQNISCHQEVLKIVRTENPLFHMLKQLRNYNIHIGYSNLGYTEPVKIIRGNQELIEKGEALEYEDNFCIIDNVSLEEFNKLKDAHRYELDDKIRMIEWLNVHQQKWGIAHLVHLATNQYCDMITQYYKI